MPRHQQNHLVLTAPELSHQEARARIDQSLEDWLDSELVHALDAHLHDCRACRAYRQTLQAALDAVQLLPKAQPSQAARQRLLDLPRW
jgi:hypothetical protein